MRYEISITMDNAAFECQPGAEVARILRDLADDCENAARACVSRPALGLHCGPAAGREVPGR